MRFFTAAEPKLVVTPPASLEDKLRLTSQTYAAASSRLASLKAKFEATKLSISTLQYSNLRDEIEQQELLVEAALSRLADAEIAFNEHQRVEYNKVEDERREQRRKVLSSSIDEIGIELEKLQALYGAIPDKIHLLRFQHSQLLQELTKLL